MLERFDCEQLPEEQRIQDNAAVFSWFWAYNVSVTYAFEMMRRMSEGHSSSYTLDFNEFGSTKSVFMLPSHLIDEVPRVDVECPMNRAIYGLMRLISSPTLAENVFNYPGSQGIHDRPSDETDSQSDNESNKRTDPVPTHYLIASSGVSRE